MSTEYQQLLEQARTDLLYYYALLNPHYILAKHQKKMIEAIMKLFKGDIHKLAISLPPGHSKSEVGSVTFPSFVLGKNPQDKVLLISYGSDLAGDFGAKSKLIMESDLYREVFPDMRLLNRGNSSSKWDTTTKKGITPGGLRAVGRNGSIMGFRTNFLIVDDLVKNKQEAMNPRLMTEMFNWYQTDMRSRLLPHGKELLIMTRWGVNDLIGRMTSMEDDWTVINFPAQCINPENDPLGREKGEYLWADFYPAKWYEDRKANKEDWESLYQGNPKAFEGKTFKDSYWAYYDSHQLPDNPDLVFLSADTASKKDQRSDHSVILVWYAKKGQMYLVDFWRDKVEFPDLQDQIKSMGRKWKADAIAIEDASSGIAISQSMARATKGMAVFPVRKGNNDKVQKLNAVLGEYKAHNVILPVKEFYTELIEEEHRLFPAGEQDDMVDAIRVGVKWFFENQEGDVKKLIEQRRLKLEGYNIDDMYNRANRLNYRRRKYSKGYKNRMPAFFG